MKRLLLVTTLTVLMISSAGCGGRLWSWWHRGAPCTGAYEPAAYSTGACDSAPFVHGALMPQISGIAPGPAIEQIPAP